MRSYDCLLCIYYGKRAFSLYFPTLEDVHPVEKRKKIVCWIKIVFFNKMTYYIPCCPKRTLFKKLSDVKYYVMVYFGYQLA